MIIFKKLGMSISYQRIIDIYGSFLLHTDKIFISLCCLQHDYSKSWSFLFKIVSKTRSSQLIENEFEHIETYAKLLETICEINVTKGC